MPCPPGRVVPRPEGRVVPRPAGNVVPRPAGKVVPRAVGNVVPPPAAGNVDPDVVEAEDEDPSSHLESSKRSCEQPLAPAISNAVQMMARRVETKQEMEFFLIMAG